MAIVIHAPYCLNQTRLLIYLNILYNRQILGSRLIDSVGEYTYLKKLSQERKWDFRLCVAYIELRLIETELKHEKRVKLIAHGLLFQCYIFN